MKTIRQMREELFWTQFDLAAKVGVRPETISTWERGERRPRDQHIRRIAKVFNVTPHDIELPDPEKKEAA